LSTEPLVDFADEANWCAAYLRVRTKQGELIPATWGPAQVKLFDAIAKQRARNQPVRIVYLKARQVFVSTGTAMAFFRATAFQAGQRTQVYAHDDDSAQRIFEYYERFNDHYGGPQPLPAITRRNRSDGIQYNNGSAIEVRTAGSVRGGRSRTTRRLHLSEYAFWPDAEALMTGLLQSIPDDPDTMIVVESTANGMGGAFHDLWKAAVAGDNDYLPIFFAWHEHPEYARPLDVDPAIFQTSLDNDETALQREGVQLDQLNWRRWAIRNKCEGKIERFRQEYPATPDEAFQASGKMRIPAYVIALHKAKPADRAELKYQAVGRRETPLITETPYGSLHLWNQPEPERNYVIGCDVVEGEEASDQLDGSDLDYAVADVFSWPVGLQVAQLRDRYTPTELGHYLFDLGRWYNWALIGIEVNGGWGQAALQVLLDRQYPRDRIAKRMIYDGEGKPVGAKLGFKVKGTNREEIFISGLETALGSPGDGGIIIRSQQTLNELYTFHILRGKAQATSGEHDDCIFSAAHAVEAMKQAATVFAAKTDRAKPLRYAVDKRQAMREGYR